MDAIGLNPDGYPSNLDHTFVDHGFAGCRTGQPDPPPSAYKNGIVTPHADALALRYAPKEAVADLAKLQAIPGMYGAWGFRDAVNVDTKQVDDWYLSLDQSILMGAIGNVEWIGTPLAPLLEECGPLKRGIEVVFFGGDEKIEKVREKDYLQNFTRSLHVSDALRDEVLLCWEMNGEPLTQGHGAPVRLVVPGWFGIAWVKWLHRIEVMDHRYMSKYMAREYVTLRGDERGGKTVWHETSVGPINTKSIIARAARLPAGPVRLTGAAWTDGTPLERVEVRIDDGPWRPATLSKKPRARYAWRFFEFEWTKPEPGEHLVVSRAIDAEGRIQPPASDPSIRLKKTYWEASQQWPRRIRIEA